MPDPNVVNPILSLHRSFFSKKCEGSSHWLWRARWKVTLAWLLFRLWANREKKLGRNRWQKKQERRTPEKLTECFCLLPLFQLLWRPACFLDSLEFQEFSIINQVYRFLISTEAACAREWNMDVYCGYFHSTFPSTTALLVLYGRKNKSPGGWKERNKTVFTVGMSLWVRGDTNRANKQLCQDHRILDKLILHLPFNQAYCILCTTNVFCSSINKVKNRHTKH